LNTRPKNPLVQLEESPFPPLGNLIKAIDAKVFEDTDGDENTYLGIKDVELIASYNWADQKTPKIIVPGAYSQICSMKSSRFLTLAYNRLSASLETIGRSPKA
jgi:hypothetical protein